MTGNCRFRRVVEQGAAGCITNGGIPPRLRWGSALGSARSPAEPRCCGFPSEGLGALALVGLIRAALSTCGTEGRVAQSEASPVHSRRLPSVHSSSTPGWKSRSDIWESQGSRYPRPHLLCDPLVNCHRFVKHQAGAIWIGCGNTPLPCPHVGSGGRVALPPFRKRGSHRLRWFSATVICWSLTGP